MSEYQRFIAYVYEYQKGKKAGSCGFLKVEIRNSICKIELHLDCPGLPPETEARAYGFFRQNGLMNGILLGSCRTQADGAECILECNAENLMDTAVPFKRIGGIVILTQAGGFFGTEWDDQPIQPDHFQEVKSTPQDMPSQQIELPAAQDIPQQQIDSPTAQDMTQQQIDSPATQDMKHQNKSPAAQSNASRQEPPIVQEDASNQEHPIADTPKPIKKETPTSVEASAIPIRHPYSFPGEEFTPFDDTDFLRCWKIHPNDLMRCAPGVRSFLNNRFLQYGFYNFGHLLLGVRSCGKYILGVPGGYDPQERFMANMFGFPYFRESRMIELPKNRGGYWYRSINAPNFH